LLNCSYSGRAPKGFEGLGEDGLDLFKQGLARSVVRFLVQGGGALRRTAVIRGERRHQHFFLDDQQEPLTLHFSRPLYRLLQHLFLSGGFSGLSNQHRGPFTVADNIVLLMIARRQERGRDALRLNGAGEIVSLGYLPAIFYPGTWIVNHTPEIPDDPAVGHVLYALHTLLFQSWFCGEETMHRDVSLNMENALTRAESRERAWKALFGYVQKSKRYELLAPACRMEAALFADSQSVSKILAAFDKRGNLRYDSERQPVYARLLSGYSWLEETHRLRKTRVSRYDDDYDQIRVFQACAAEVPKDARIRGMELLSRLRFEI